MERMRRRRNTNHPLCALAVVAGLALAVALGGWLASGWYTAGFLIGGFGTAINAERARRLG